ncbi:basic salivary proline-rich protein 1 [Bos taurus]|uniref:basic salivary proline-rich protein 1 n=1 Tax=Bos taurus TaxID=9913 RepID=UPI0028CB8160|nr:basic salivary proline-rich protein 1-like [Bos taurus]XP_059737577.1 basic salivary proline-rich protein 1-like [Bos taurus]
MANATQKRLFLTLSVTRTREGPAPLLPWVSLEEPACNPVPSPQHPLAAGGPACGPHLSTPGNLPVIPAAPHPARGSRGFGVPTSQSFRRPAQEEAGVSGGNSGRSHPPPGRRSRRPRPTPAVSTHRSLLCPPGLTPARARGWRLWRGPVARPGRRARPPPSFRPSRGVPRAPPPPADPPPRRPAAAAARATARLSRDRPRGRRGPRDAAGQEGRGAQPPYPGSPGVPAVLAPLPPGHENPKGAHHSWLLGASRVAVSRDPRRGGDESRKPGHPSLSLPSDGMGKLRFLCPWVWPASPGKGEP